MTCRLIVAFVPKLSSYLLPKLLKMNMLNVMYR